MLSISAKITVAAGISLGLLLSGAGAASATVETAAPVAGSGSSSGSGNLVQTGSSGSLSDPLAIVLCTLTGGNYSMGTTPSTTHPGHLGCVGGLFGQ